MICALSARIVGNAKSKGESNILSLKFQRHYLYGTVPSDTYEPRLSVDFTIFDRLFPRSVRYILLRSYGLALTHMALGYRAETIFLP